MVLEAAAIHVTSYLMAPHAGMQPTSVTYWSTAVGPPPSAQQMCTFRMGGPVPMVRHTATMEHVKHWIASASTFMAKVSNNTSFRICINFYIT